MLPKDATGRFGEDLAARYLTDLGWEVIERNWRCGDGELDIVAREGTTLVFCEVKTRSSAAFGDPAEAVAGRKAARIRRLAARWLAEHTARRTPEVRFDVVSVVRPPGTGATLRHLRGAF